MSWGRGVDITIIWGTKSPLSHVQSSSSVQFSSVTQSCPTLCNPMNRSMPGLPVHHQLLEFTQTHVHRVSDAIQPSHPLSSPSPPAPNPSQHQSFPVSQLFSWGGQSTGVSALASVLPKKSQDWSPSEWTDWISLQSKGLLRVFSNTTVQKHQFFCAQPSSEAQISPQSLKSLFLLHCDAAKWFGLGPTCKKPNISVTLAKVVFPVFWGLQHHLYHCFYRKICHAFQKLIYKWISEHNTWVNWNLLSKIIPIQGGIK